MSLILNNIKERIDRSIEEAIYQVLLQNDLCPDREAYADNPSGYADKQAEILATQGFCIEVFGNGSSHDRATRFIPRIVEIGLGFLPGSLGNDGVPYYKLDEISDKYIKLNGPPMSSTYRFELELVSNKTKQDAVLEAVRAKALPNRVYIPMYDNPNEQFLITYGFIRQAPVDSHGITQRIYLYEIHDIFEQLPETISTEIAKIKEITVVEKDESIIIKTP